MENGKNKTIKDLIGISDYAKALKTYIEKDEEPKTISLEGDWGCGKSTLLDILEHDLENENKIIKFDAWQFSQFNDGKILPILLIKKIIYDLNIESADLFDKLSKIGKNILKSVFNHYVKSKTNGILEGKDWIDIALEKSDVEIYIGLKNELKDAVEIVLKEHKCNQLIIMVDDLDRIEPVRAIEIMETINNFLTFQKCKLILAIDYNVVVTGFNSKYGTSIDNKANKFFEKIIQVPFKMPVYDYKINRYIEDKCNKIFKNNEEYNIDDYVSCIKNSIDFNLRSIERLFNAFDLYKIINKNCNDNMILFITLCMQFAYYDELLKIKNCLKYSEFKEKINNILQESIEVKNDFFNQFYEKINTEEMYKTFMNIAKSSDAFFPNTNFDNSKIISFVNICNEYYEKIKNEFTSNVPLNIKPRGHRYKKEYYIEYLNIAYERPIGVVFRFTYKDDTYCSFSLTIRQDKDKKFKELFDGYNFINTEYEKKVLDSSITFPIKEKVNYHNDGEMHELMDIILKEKDELLTRLK